MHKTCRSYLILCPMKPMSGFSSRRLSSCSALFSELAIHRHIPGFAWLNAESDADKLCAHGTDIGRLRIDAESLSSFQVRDELVQSLFIIDEMISDFYSSSLAYRRFRHLRHFFEQRHEVLFVIERLTFRNRASLSWKNVSSLGKSTFRMDCRKLLDSKERSLFLGSGLFLFSGQFFWMGKNRISVPNSVRREAAVFGPKPSSPGILSEASPTMAR